MSTDSAAAGPPPAAALSRAVRTYLDHLAVERGLARHTLSAYRRDLDRYLTFLAGAEISDLSDISARHVSAHLGALRAGDDDHPPLAAASAARAISAVRGFHRFALRERLVGTDPSRDVTPPAPPKRLPKALEVDDIEQLLGGVLGDEPLALRDRALLEFLYGTGARISEAVGAARDDLDLDGRTAILRGKGGRTRLVPIGGFAVKALEAYLVRGRPALAEAGTGTSAIFLNAKGGRLSRQSAWTIMRRAGEVSGLDVTRLSPHALRHSYATHLIDGGADVRTVQELLGHASVTTTQVYTLVTAVRLREAYVLAHPRARSGS